MIVAAFTSSDWFQLAYPAFWFLLGLIVGDRRAAGETNDSPRPISVVQVIEVRLPGRTPRPKRPPPQRSSEGSDDDFWGQIVLFFLGGLLAVATLAYVFVEWREVMLAIASGFLALTLGVVLGTVRRRVRLGMFAGDWRVASAVILVLGMAAVATGYFLLHPLEAPAEYTVLFDAYRREGWDALLSFDSNVWLFAYQAIGAVILIFASAALLLASLACVAKGALVAGCRTARLRLWLAGYARGPGMVAGLFAGVVVLLGLAFVCGAGYANRVARNDARPDTPRFLVPTVDVRGRAVVVAGVASANGLLRLRVTFERASGRSKPFQRQWRIVQGREELTTRLPKGRVAKVLLTPTRGKRAVGDPVAFRCDRSGACARIPQ